MPKDSGKSAGSAYTVRRLDQVKILADPLRLRILRAFVGRPRTTKQVADLLGEPAPRLYRHVDALRRAGLLRLVDERRKRGTVERYLEAVATRFEVDRAVFESGEAGKGPEGRDKDDAENALRALFRTTESEFTSLIRHPKGEQGFQPVAARFNGYATREQLVDLRSRLLEWLRSCEANRGGGGGGGEDETVGTRFEFGGMVVLHASPADVVDLPADGGREDPRRLTPGES
jgi:DNA-binding transcriptional ArsR family regulator